MSTADLAGRLQAAEATYLAGDVDAAVEQLLALVEAAGDPHLLAQAHGDLAVIAFEHGQVDSARSAAREALAHDRAHVPALETLGRCCAAAGDHFQAAHWLRRAAAEEPCDAGLWRTLGAEEHAAARWNAAIAALERAADLEPLPSADAERLASARHWLTVDSRRGPLPEVRDERRLLVCVDFFWPSIGGLEHISEGVGQAMQDYGWTVEIACRKLPQRHVYTRHGMPIHEIEGEPEAGLRAVVEQRRPDAVLAFSDPQAWPVPAALALPPGPRVVVVPCITADVDRRVRTARFLPLYRRMLERADVVVHNSERGYDAWLDRDLGVDAVYVPQAIADVPPEGSIREDLGLRDDLPLLVYIANLHPHKNHAGLLEALVDRPGEWQLVLAGFHSPGVPEEALRVWRLAERDPRVRIAPGMKPAKVAATMLEADLFLCPSHSDAVPLVIQESMCHGLPWVATPGCGAVHDWAGGVILPVEDFGVAVDHLLADDVARAALGAAGRSHWEACFNYGVAPQCYDALLRGASAVPDFPAPPDALSTTDAIRRDVYEALIAQPAPAGTAA